MFWRRRKHSADPTERPAPPPEPAAPVPADRVLDLVAELLRIYGEHAFDVGELRAEETREQCEGWARHLLVGTPPPGREPPGGSDETAADLRHGGLPRDLPGLRGFFDGHRQEEARLTRASLGDFREAVWTFIQGLRRSITAEEASDRQVSFRMRRLEQAVQRNQPEEIKREALETLGVLSETMGERSSRQRAHLEELSERLERLRGELESVRERAARDDLTGLYNRASFDRHVARVVDFSMLLGKSAHLVMLDVDHFKWVNDTHGHPAGDEVLRRVAGVLARSFLRKDDFVARYGGEEFGVVLREGTAESARMLAERALDAVRALEVERDGESIRVTASAGVTSLRRGEGPGAWVERADRLLYEAKEAGRDRVVDDEA